jgi:hypothetical protein
MVSSVNRKLEFWYIFCLIPAKYTAVISIGSPPSLDTRYEFRQCFVTLYKRQICTRCIRRHEPFIQQLTQRIGYVTFRSTCGTPLTATTLHLQGITKEAVPHSDPSTLGNAVQSQYMKGIYKANRHASLRYSIHGKDEAYTQHLSAFRTASHGIRRQHMLVYFYAEENNTLWLIY